ncbi:FAD-dependent oxidoreductase [Alkalicoccus halolimnae]|uniref:FAD-dependent oxidoreductase n=1 Tax=Alkalicoccus halolimnae TaxID=1667239 RepID=A0A5C7FNW7_9BACI|nr:FAD-dependent oxidoreductase [Alkalicoccus halolimnae]TXF87036.1 CoA-disulfide reductase [Alkalicoccus halolimnae]
MKLVIIGGDAAGMSAAMQVVHKRKDAEITVLERGPIYSYAQCGLPYFIGGVVEDTESLIARPVSFFREKGIDARVHHEVTDVDADKQTVSGNVLDTGETFELEYDTLLVATGGSPNRLSVEGADLEGIHVLKTIPDAEKIAADFEGKQNITVIGAGYIGLEIAENFVEQGKNVRMINRTDKLGSNFDEPVSDMLRKEAERHGITLSLHEDVDSFTGDEEGRVKAVKTNKDTYETDGVITAIGITPNTSFLEGTGIYEHASGAILVDPYMRTNKANIYAAGDCATQYNRIKEQHDYVPLGTHANKQGRIAGANIAGDKKTFQGMLGTAILKFFDITAGRTGIDITEAKSLGFDFSVKSFEPLPYAGYYPGAEPITLQLIKDNKNERLLGVQAAGKDGVDKRIDVASVMLFNKMTVDEIQDLDISYAPPYNSTWDPIQRNVRRL